MSLRPAFLSSTRILAIATATLISLIAGVSAFAQASEQTGTASPPWMDRALSPDRRADLVVGQMTQQEKITMVHGIGWGVLRKGSAVPPGDVGGAGFVPGVPRLGIPPLNLADSAVGVRMAGFYGRYATLLPSTLGAASSWDPDSAQLYGSVIGRELRDEGFNMSIGGGVDLTREPRNGRNFEYAGEDPLLAGTMTGNLMRGLQAQQIMGDIKHFAMNDQETGRNILNAVISEKAMRESDLLAFQISIGIADPSAVMCAYNKVNGDWSCENDYLLNQVLKHDFAFKGWVMSDWGGTHTTVKAALAGLDQEQPGDKYFGAPLAEAITAGKVPQSRLDDMVHRILRSMFAAGVIDNPPVPSVPDPFRGRDEAQRIEEESLVVLRNEGSILPLSNSAKRIALIGGHADVGVLSGGGSAQVDAPGGNAIGLHTGPRVWCEPVYFPSSPLREIRSLASGGNVTYDPGTDPAKAAAAAQNADVVFLFATQHMCESRDAATLALPDNQDALIEAVAKANPNTVVVLETGGPVSMPWHNQVKGIIEAWYPGIGGAQALAAVLFGRVNPSGKLSITFPASDQDLPHPHIAGLTPEAVGKAGAANGSGAATDPFEVDYTEGARVGYKWFESENKTPLYPFGYGLSYTSFAYSDLKLDPANKVASFTIRNTGSRAGVEIAQVYAALPASAGEHYMRLVGWARANLAPGESKQVSVNMNPLTLSVFNTAEHRFEMPKGEYRIEVGTSSSQILLQGTMTH